MGKWCAVLPHPNIGLLLPNSVRGLDLPVYSVSMLLLFIERRLATGRTPAQEVLSGIYKKKFRNTKSGKPRMRYPYIKAELNSRPKGNVRGCRSSGLQILVTFFEK